MAERSGAYHRAEETGQRQGMKSDDKDRSCSNKKTLLKTGEVCMVWIGATVSMVLSSFH